jgi:hypothetical protein
MAKQGIRSLLLFVQLFLAKTMDFFLSFEMDISVISVKYYFKDTFTCIICFSYESLNK